MSDELENHIRENAAAPARITGDQGSVEQHTLQDQIAADRYLASKAASRQRGLAVKILKIVPPGTN